MSQAYNSIFGGGGGGNINPTTGMPYGSVADEIIPQNARFPGDPGSGGIAGGYGPSTFYPSGGGMPDVNNIPAISEPSAPGSWGIYLPPGGSVETEPGGIAPGFVGSIPAAGPAGGASNIGKIISGVGQGAGGIMGLVNSFRSSPTEKALEKGQKLGMQNAQVASQAGQQQLAQYESGSLSPAQQAAVDQYKKQQLAQWRNYFARAGIPESSAMADVEAKVNMDAMAYGQQLLQQNYLNSMNALGLGSNTLAQQATANLAYEKEIAKSQADAMAAIGQLAGILGEVV